MNGALSTLGTRAALKVVGTVPTFEFFSEPSPYLQDYTDFYFHAMAVQGAVRGLISETGHGNLAELSPAALLHDLGKLRHGSADHLPDPDFCQYTSPQLLVKEQNRLGTDHAHVGGELLSGLGLPQQITEPVADHHEASGSLGGSLIKLADMLAHYRHRWAVGPDQILDASAAIRLSRESLERLMYASSRPIPSGAGASHHVPLTARETELLRCLAEGKAYKRIALDLRISPSTVRNHLHHIYEKLGTADRAQAVLQATREGWI